MNPESSQKLADLLRTHRIASLGTLRAGSPLVTLVLYAVSRDFCAFWLHLSKLAFHTRDIHTDPRVGLMIAEVDDGTRDPQTLARVSLVGEALAVEKDTTEFEEGRNLYTEKHPEAEHIFSLGDFDLYRIEPKSARFVAGFGEIFNLSLKDFKKAAEKT